MKVLVKNVHPYMFRHGNWTQTSRFYTDWEMKIMGGWKSTKMLETYSHLNMKDVDDKTLQLHGLKPPEKTLTKLIQVEKCSNCNEDNAPFSMYCKKCNHPLSEDLNVDKLIKNKDDLVKLAQALKDYGLKIERA